MSEFQIVFSRREFAELVPIALEESSLAPDEVAGHTLASLVSAGTELGYAYCGESFPARPGYAAVFQVEEIGSAVEGIRIGDRVLAMGAHCSYQRHKAIDVWRVPDGLPSPFATFARLMGVSMSTLSTTTSRPPERVIITGLGPVGHLAAQVFGACGYTVLGFDPDMGRRAFAEEKGISTCEQLPLDDASWKERVALVLECSGHEGAALDACQLVKKRGEVVLVGVPWRKRTELSAHELLNTIFHRYAVVRSGWEWEIPRHLSEFCAGSIAANIEAALAWLENGKVRVEGLSSSYSPHDCQSAYQGLLHARQPKLAVVFDWTQLTS